jgi:hypothetical protein
VVATIDPLAAPAQQWVVSAQAIASSVWNVPEFCALQGEAPFVVAIIAPKVPAERHVVVLGQAIPLSVNAEAAFSCTDQVPAAAAAAGPASPAEISRATAATTSLAGLRLEGVIRSEVAVVL